MCKFYELSPTQTDWPACSSAISPLTLVLFLVIFMNGLFEWLPYCIFFCPGCIESLDACLVAFIISETVYLFCQYLVNKTLHCTYLLLGVIRIMFR